MIEIGLSDDYGNLVLCYVVHKIALPLQIRESRLAKVDNTN